MADKKSEVPIFSPTELTELLTWGALHNKQFLITGSPGQGKTDIVKQVAAATKHQLIITHPVTEDPTDYKGMPAIIQDPETEETKAVFLPFDQLYELITAKKKTIHFADDLGPAAKMVQAAYMQLIQGKHVNGHKVSDKVIFWAATNRKQDKAAVQSIIEPLKDRWDSVVGLENNVKCWTQWYQKQNLPFEVLNFVRYKGDVLNAWEPTADMSRMPTPRGLEQMAKALRDNIPSKLMLRTFQGQIGKKYAYEFKAFLDIYKELPDPDAVIAKPMKAEIPTKPGHLYALCGALANRATSKNIENIIRYADRLDDEADKEEFCVLLVKDAVNREPTELCKNNAFIAWAQKHQEVII